MLKKVKEISPEVITKSGLMLGLGEDDWEVEEVLRDLREAGCDMLTLGQYLAPSLAHAPVVRYVTPEEFAGWRRKALEMGFRSVAAAPLVRSSYKAPRSARGSKMKTWRFLDTGASPGSLNMAIDQAILAMHARGESPPTLRIYQWSPPAISLGYFQRRHGIDLAACRRLGIDVVRRPTGGRAVLHFEDLTYAIVAGTTDGIPSSVTAAYRLICEGLLAAFRVLGFEAELGRQGAGSPRSDICFLTSTAGDMLHKGKKFVGSAQTWHGSSMLQHGSIVLEPHTRDTGHAPTERALDLQQLVRTVMEQRMTSVSEILGRVPGTRRNRRGHPAWNGPHGGGVHGRQAEPKRMGHGPRDHRSTG